VCQRAAELRRGKSLLEMSQHEAFVQNKELMNTTTSLAMKDGQIPTVWI
jgi:hypothetical protein